ncbi:MAG: ATP-binding cassette domain-containing protein [Planctomycetota bacterium]|nr:MAG: ATP-binding cassette domain-containing protein [Planctomycetota bacterium]
MLRLENVSKTYDGKRVVDPYTTQFAPGQTHVLIGPSGCGKSTLLRLMLGLIPPTSGNITFDAVRLTPESRLAIRQRVGYVIQDGGLFPHLTAAANVQLMARYLGWDASRLAARTAELAELTHFPQSGLDRYPAQLSGGQQQRVSLMRALMLDPEVLMLDEPLGALDPMIRAELQADLKAIFARLAKTVILVTHDMGEAAFLADTIVLMREGRVVQQGSFQELLETPAESFVTDFINAQRSPLSEGAT